MMIGKAAGHAATGASRVRVLLVDDARRGRSVAAALTSEPELQVEVTPCEPASALEVIVRFAPDVVVLDVDAPTPRAANFLRYLMARRPMPVVAACSRTDRASAAAVEALQAGAVDVLIKPEEARAGREMASRLARSVRDLRAGASPRFRAAVPEGLPVALAAGSARHHDGLLLFGAASGGTQAVESLLTCLPVEGPPVLVVLHLPPPLTSAFADRLDRVCPMHVVEARGGELIDPGVAYIAPGDRHLVVEQYGTRLRTALRDGPPVHYRRPAIDVLFHSAARLTGVPTAAAILTGMGQDGADGLLALKLAGAQTFAEDEQSCVVFGMPKEAIDRGAATQVLPLFDMPEQMLASLGRAVRAGTSGSAS